MQPSYSAIDTLWVLLGAALVFFMQAGFAMVETGFTRAKNAGNIVMKNLMDFSIGSVVYFIVGFGLMYGDDAGGFIGVSEFAAQLTSHDWVDLIFQTVFCATSATIVSGAMAERTKFSSYCIYSLVISLIVYPISGHWGWGGGWLSQMGFHDFAGSALVHMVGGVAALVGAIMLGPRIGKYEVVGKKTKKNGKTVDLLKPRAIPGHSLTLGALGVFILWFAWFGFNGASSFGVEGQEVLVGRVFVTTNIAAAMAACTTMVITWIRYKKPDVSMTLNAVLGGLVAITAGCAVVEPWAAVAIGFIAGFIVVFGVELLDKVLKIDDPVGAVAVHGMCGIFGTLAVGIFGSKTLNPVLVSDGLIYGEGLQFGVQLLGVVAICAWVVVTMGLTFFIIKKTHGLRVPAHEEIQGLDINEHNIASSYADFVPAHVDTDNEPIADLDAPIKAAKAEQKIVHTAKDGKYTRISIITRPEKFNDLRLALQGLGVTGMTVTQVSGCGMQHGATEYYRGTPVDIKVLPKIKVELVVSKIAPEAVIGAAESVLRTGSVGDGKIFISDIEDVVKVRTGERGYDALQDEEPV